MAFLNRAHLAPRACQDTNRAIGAQAAEIEPKVAFPSFAEAVHLDSVDAWRQPIQAMPYPYQNGPLARVYKEGAALRQVGTVASSWRECTRPAAPAPSLAAVLLTAVCVLSLPLQATWS